MSRPINITSAVTFNPTGTTGSSNISTSTSYPLSNGYNGTSNTSRYARLQLSANNTSTTCYIYYTFNVNGIPSNATINSVSCTARIYRNNRVTQNTSAIQLYNGTTAKGSATTGLTTTASNIQIASTGSWTVSELSNIRLRISGVRSSTNNNSYIYFYGADLTINYTVNGVEYEITATSEYNGASVSPSSQFILQGEDAIVRIDTDTLDNMVLEDNGTDVTENLQYVVPQGGTLSFTGIPISFDYTNSVYDTSEGTNGVYDTNYIDNGLTNHTSTTRAAIYATKGNNADTYIYYNFDCSSIPSNATITSVSCQVKAGNQGTSYYNSSYRQVQLCVGTTTKGTYQSVTGSNTSPTTVTVDGGSSWTRSELDDIKIRYWARRGTSNTNTGATISFYGATLTVQYTLPQEPYYQYTISNVGADHEVVFKEAIIIPPEEEPNKTYYSLTISSINATTDPGRGTTRVESGSSQTVLIYPTDPLVTLIRDNGVDVSGQLVYYSGTSQPTYTVSTAQGASYGFTLNTGTGYYTSQNTGVDKSASVSRIDFDLPATCIVTFQFINYAEAAYDFGVFGNIDTALSNDYYEAGSDGATITDSSYKLACNTSTYNTSSVQTLTYEIPAGRHYIYVKYSKDDASEDNNDSLQWKISNIEMTSVSEDAHYEYTLSNINQDHSLIFIFGDVTYYFITSSGAGNARLYPDGQMVCLPGDTYKLAVVPENPEDIITATDNSSDITNNLERKEVVTEKNGQSALTVNYVYTLTNVQSAHTILVQDASATFYGVSASSTYVGATVSPSAQTVVEGRNALIDITVNNLYEIKVKDNGVDVTSSLYANDSDGYSYTILNVESAHTVVVEEAPYYTISTASTYANATITASPSKVYSGRSTTLTLSVPNIYEVIVKDGNTDITNNFTGSNGTFTYMLNNVNANHTISVQENTYYNVTVNNLYAGATGTAVPSKVYVGRDSIVTIDVENLYEIKVKDNGTDVTSSVTGTSGNYSYAVSNVQSAHTITVEEAPYKTITANSTYTNATVSPSTQKVYAGRSGVVTITTTNYAAIDVKDNGTDVKSSLVSIGSNQYTYTITNPGENHTVAVSQKQYSVMGSSAYSSARISPTQQTVYHGASTTLSITGAPKYEIIVKDNGADVTSQVNGTGTNLIYTIQSVTETHVVTVQEANSYQVTATSNYTGATTSSPGKIYAGQSARVPITVNDVAEIVLTDNGETKTSSITGSSGNYGYVITNVSTAHTVIISEAPSYNVSGTSTYNGATLTVPGKTYRGQSATVTIAVANLYEVVIKDNGNTITNSFTGSSGTYRYTFTNVTTSHNITVEEAPYSTISTSSDYEGATISANPTKVYNGRSCTVTITVANKYEIKLTDNNTDVTSSVVGSTNSLTYTLTNVQADHTLVVSEATNTTVTANSQWTGASITTSRNKLYAGQTATITVTIDALYKVVIKDNGTEVTSSFTGSNGTFTYSVASNTGNHSFVVTERTKYTITASSTHSTISVSPASQQVYSGQSATITLSGTLQGFVLLDNSVNVTSQLAGNSYTISNVNRAHTVSITENQFYISTGTSDYTGVTISPSTAKTYSGDDLVFTLTGLIPDIRLEDNGTNVTSQIVYTDGTTAGTYTIQGVTSAHTVSAIETETFTVSVVSTYSAVTISPASVTVHEGQNAVFTMTGDYDFIKVLDNGVDITETTTGNILTIRNVREAHSITIAEGETDGRHLHYFLTDEKFVAYYNDNRKYFEPFASYTEEDDLAHYDKMKCRLRYTTVPEMPAGTYTFLNNIESMYHQGFMENAYIYVDGVKYTHSSGFRTSVSAGVHVVDAFLPFSAVTKNLFSVNSCTVGGYIDEMRVFPPVEVIEASAFIANGLRKLVLPRTIKYIGNGAISQNRNLAVFNGKIINGSTIEMPNLRELSYGNLGLYTPKKFIFKKVEIWGGETGIYATSISGLRPEGGIELEFSNTLHTVYGGAIDRCWIKNLILHSETPPTFVSNSGNGGDVIFFQSTLYGNIMVPSASVNAYKSAPGWSAVASSIIANPDE